MTKMKFPRSAKNYKANVLSGISSPGKQNLFSKIPCALLKCSEYFKITFLLSYLKKSYLMTLKTQKILLHTIPLIKVPFSQNTVFIYLKEPNFFSFPALSLELHTKLFTIKLRTSTNSLILLN